MDADQIAFQGEGGGRVGEEKLESSAPRSSDRQSGVSWKVVQKSGSPQNNLKNRSRRRSNSASTSAGGLGVPDVDQVDADLCKSVHILESGKDILEAKF